MQVNFQHVGNVSVHTPAYSNSYAHTWKSNALGNDTQVGCSQLSDLKYLSLIYVCRCSPITKED